MKKRNQIFVFIFLFFCIVCIQSCCNIVEYEKKDFEFTNEELSYLSCYKVGDTITFKSNKLNYQRIVVQEIDEERVEGGSCFMSPNPSHIIIVRVEHLPIDNWKSECLNCSGNVKTVTYQPLISFGKEPLGNNIGYGISFRDFYGNIDSISKYPFKDVKFNDSIIIKNCYKIEHLNPNEIKDSNDIEFVYWTKEYGLTAFVSKAGEKWMIEIDK